MAALASDAGLDQVLAIRDCVREGDRLQVHPGERIVSGRTCSDAFRPERRQFLLAKRNGIGNVASWAVHCLS
ncbi:MAG: hypothetical protein WBO00_07770 [Steroidobacteraceae bacterium]